MLKRSLFLLITGIFFSFWGSLTSRESEVFAKIISPNKGIDIRDINFYDNFNQLLRRDDFLSTRRFKTEKKGDNFETSFWFNPGPVKNLVVTSPCIEGKCESSHLQLKNELFSYQKALDFGLTERKEIYLPSYIRDPFKYSDIVLVVVLGIIGLWYLKKAATWINRTFALSNGRLKKPILVASSTTLLFLLLYTFHHQKVYEPFTIHLQGKHIPLTHFVIYLDTGKEFNEVEKITGFNSRLRSARKEPYKLSISNSSTDADRNEVFISQVRINGEPKELSSLVGIPQGQLIRGRLYLASQEKIELFIPSPSVLIEVLKHPTSGEITLKLNGQRVAREALFSPKERTGYKIQLNSRYISRIRKAQRTVSMKIEHPFWGTPVQKIKITDANFGQRIYKVTFIAQSGITTQGILTIKADGLVASPINVAFNHKESPFFIICTVLFLILQFGAFFALALTFTTLRKNISGKAFLFSFVIIGTSLSAVLMNMWPGVYTADSLIFADIGRSINNYKPLFYSLYLGIIASFSSHPSAPLIVRIPLLTTLLSLLISIGVRYNVKWYWYLLFIVMLILSPVVPLYTMTLWKDIPYALGILAIGVLLFFLLLFQRTSNYKLVVLALFLVLLPLTVFTSNIRHNGVLIPLTVATVLYFTRLVNLERALLFVVSALVMQVFIVAFINSTLTTKPLTNYKRLTLLPYVVYSSYIPWDGYLSDKSLEEVSSIKSRVTPIAAIEDQIGMPLMFNSSKINLLASYEEIRLYKQEVRNAIFSNPVSFLGNLIRANVTLLGGYDYVWDEGLLPLHHSFDYDKDDLYFSTDYALKRHPFGSHFGGVIKDLSTGMLHLRERFEGAKILFSAVPHIIILLLTVLMYRKWRATALFALFCLASYAGVFLMPGSCEFRYGFHLLLCSLVVPLLIGIERAVREGRSTV